VLAGSPSLEGLDTMLVIYGLNIIQSSNYSRAGFQFNYFYEIVFKVGDLMPYVNIKITKEAVTSEQKAELISGVTELLQRVLNKNPATTVVIIDEVDTDNWGIAGEQVSLRRKREK